MATYRFIMDGREGEIPLSEPPVSARQLEEIVRREAKMPRRAGSTFEWPDDPERKVRAPENPAERYIPHAASVPTPAEPGILQRAGDVMGGLAETVGVSPAQTAEEARDILLETAKRNALPVAGGVVGGMAGAALGGPSLAGVPAGVMAGEAVGSAVGEAVTQFLRYGGKVKPEEVFLAMVAPAAGRVASYGSQQALKQLMKHTAGGKAAINLAGAAEAERATNFIPRGEVQPIYDMLDDAMMRIKQAAATNPNVRVPTTPGTKALNATKALLEEFKLPYRSGRDPQTVAVLQQTVREMEADVARGGIPIDRLQAQMSGLRQQIAATRPKTGTQQNAALHGALKKQEAAFLEEMDDAIARAERATGPVTGAPALGGQVDPMARLQLAQTQFVGEYLKQLKLAVKLYRLESGADALQEFIVNSGMHKRASDGLLQLTPGKVLEHIRKDDYLRDSLGPANVAKLEDFFERLGKIPKLEPERGQQFGAGMGLRRMSVGFLVGGWRGAVGMELGAWLVSRISLTDSGRRFLLRLFTHGATLDNVKMAAMANFLRAQSAPQRRGSSVEGPMEEAE